MKQYIYVNGVRTKTTKPNSPETLRKWLDNIEAMWSNNSFDFIEAQSFDFDPNGSVCVDRRSLDELVIVTTGDKLLRIVNK